MPRIGKTPGLEPGVRSASGSVAQLEPRFQPVLDLALDVAHSARSVGAQPYPFGELACMLEPVNVSVAIKDELSDLFLRKQP